LIRVLECFVIADLLLAIYTAHKPPHTLATKSNDAVKISISIP